MQILPALTHHDVPVHVERQQVAERYLEPPDLNQLFSDDSELVHKIWANLNKVDTVWMGVHGSSALRKT